MPVAEAARQLGMQSARPFTPFWRGPRPVSPAMALRLGKFCGNGPDIWLNMQRAYDLWHAERELADVLKTIPTHAA